MKEYLERKFVVACVTYFHPVEDADIYSKAWPCISYWTDEKESFISLRLIF